MTLDLFLWILLLGAMVATVGALVGGLFGLFKRGKKQEERRNKMMRLRIFFQAIAILIFSLLLFLKAG